VLAHPPRALLNHPDHPRRDTVRPADCAAGRGASRPPRRWIRARQVPHQPTGTAAAAPRSPTAG